MSGFDPSLIGKAEKDEVIGKIRNDLKDYFYFTDLLKKQRPIDISKQIDDFIKKESDIYRRIAFIEELDRDKKWEKESLESPDELLKHKKELPKKTPRLKRLSFFQYFFNTRRSINNFANKNHVITSTFLGLNYKFSSDGRERYKQYLIKSNSLILKPLNDVVNFGWKSLSQLEYNIVVTFTSFLKQLTHLGNVLDKENINVTIKNIDSYIKPYLTVVSNNNYKKSLTYAIDSVLNPIPSNQETLKEVLVLIDEIIDTNSDGLKFFNIVKGAYIVKFRKVIQLKNLLEHYQPTPIEDKKYLFPDKVLRDINSKLDNLKLKYNLAEKELYYLKFIDTDFKINSKNNSSLNDLFTSMFYVDSLKDFKSLSDLKREFRIDQLNYIEGSLGNLNLIFLKTIRGFLTLYERFLLGKIKVTISNKKHEVQTLSHSVFQDDLNSLRDFSNEMDNLKGRASTTLSFDVYSNFINTGETEIEREKKLCMLVNNILETFYIISQKTSNILYNHYLVKELTDNDMLQATQNQNEVITEIANKPKLIPFSMVPVAEPVELNNKLVYNVFNEIMALTINFCSLMDFYPLEERKAKKQNYLKDIEEYLQMKSKVEL